MENKPTIKQFKQITKAQRADVGFLKTQVDLYRVSYSESDLSNNDSYIRIANALFDAEQKVIKEKAKADKLRENSEAPQQRMQLACQLLNNRYKRHIHSNGTPSLMRVEDEEKMVLRKIINNKMTYDAILAREIATTALESGEVLSPKDVDSYVDYWNLYGDVVGHYDIYGGFEPKSWCLSYCKVPVEKGPMPTWMHFLNRMNDKEAFAAMIYGLVSKKYRGRQMMWLQGAEGEDGKTYVLKLLLKELFPGVSVAVTNHAFSEGAARFTAAEFEDKHVAYWDDCGNPKALMREDIKQYSGGEEAAETRVEQKGVAARNAQLHTRLIISSNLAPEGKGNAFLSRLLYVVLDPLVEAKDVTIGEKFVSELPAFLYYAEKCYEVLCPDNRTILQNEAATELKNRCVDDMNHTNIVFFDQCFEEDENGAVALYKIDELFKKHVGTRDTYALGDFYKWLEKEKGFKKVGYNKVTKEKKNCIVGIKCRSAYA